MFTNMTAAAEFCSILETKGYDCELSFGNRIGDPFGLDVARFNIYKVIGETLVVFSSVDRVFTDGLELVKKAGCCNYPFYRSQLFGESQMKEFRSCINQLKQISNNILAKYSK